MGKSRKRPREAGTARVVVGIAWYSPFQLKRLREVSADPDVLEPTHREWVASYQRTARDLTEQGLEVRKVFVDVSELEKWCRHKNLLIDGEARAQYVLERVQQSHSVESAISDE